MTLAALPTGSALPSEPVPGPGADPSRLGLVGPERAVTRYERWFKRPFDLVVASVLLIIALPVLLITAVLVGITLGRPITYRQDRLGRHGEPFRILKFRTMRPDRRRIVIPIDASDRRVTAKSPDDPRHTRLGRFVRSTSLDELPQLVQVLTGKLSLVGPRPEIYDEAVRTGAVGQPREEVRPGLTGPWQIYSRDSSDPADRLRHDNAYVERITPLGDLKLLVLTVGSVIRGTGS